MNDNGYFNALVIPHVFRIYHTSIHFVWIHVPRFVLEVGSCLALYRSSGDVFALGVSKGAMRAVR